MFNFPKILIWISTICLSSAVGEIIFSKGTPHVRLSETAGFTGTVKFSSDGKPYTSFEGINYANVPERFAPSVLEEVDWDGYKNATVPGHICPQKGSFGMVGVLGDENCLYLNVYTPTSFPGTAKSYPDGYPVMVFFHPGGLTVGNGDYFKPTYFMDEDVVIVTINYRLGVIGFVSTGDEVIPGNNGLKDQVQALKWIQKNIAKFGGNPNLVTIFGISGGGAATHYLLQSPATKGLFHRVISQSGSTYSTWAFEPNPKKVAVELATYLKCKTEAGDPSKISSQEILTCFKSISLDELKNGATEFKQRWPAGLFSFRFVPVTEPKPSSSSKNTPLLTDDPRSLQTKKDIPWMVGITKEEGVMFLGSFILANAAWLSELNKNWDDIALDALYLDKYLQSPNEKSDVAEKLRKFYFGEKSISSETKDGLYHLYSDPLGVFGVRSAALKAAKEAPVYLYQFSYRGEKGFADALLPNADKIASHADDMQFLGEVKPMPGSLPQKLDEKDEDFSRNLVRLWVSFAKNGKPTEIWGDKQAWSPISEEEVNQSKPLRWYNIDTNSGFIQESFTERMTFWEELWKKYFT